ncbi:fasciclin domain-containing protein [Dysgonomonas sp. 216]|uniref:fasciclin domain-containing protein n=1 Tax=Dysgonomonas sp. 216 TaxID=2302934 RepID=UPI0013D7EEB1|nr:fasciclin domain-containing protein [Dysgonomonas sp. 216]NDW17752.1 fasciclin domain-containing protein [Dysgonomonas sp. 216]
MNKINKIMSRISGCVIALILAGSICSCSDDTWDNHYKKDDAIVAEDNLWQSIESVPELSVFVSILKSYGYDKILSQSQAYTIFAPDNDALASLDTSDINVKSELIDNHIARFFYPASGDFVPSINTLNRKRKDLIKYAGRYFFGNAAFAQPSKTIVASNGIIHVLSDYNTFFPNIWEYLAKGSDLDSIKNYLYSFDEIIFDEASSTPGSVVDGKITYLDSVFISSNRMLRRLGYINREDSSYTMIVPNNAAWIEAYDRIKDFYVYYNPNQSTADSMQRANTAYSLMKDLIYSNSVQPSPTDSLTSTSYNTYYKPQYLFEGTEEVAASNGSLFITNRLLFKPYESWHKLIRVEAEYSIGRTNTFSTATTRSVPLDSEFKVSGGRYLYLDPSSSSGNPTVTFEIPNTLSSTYNVYCVFASKLLIKPSGLGIQPYRLFFTMSYQDNTGATRSMQFPSDTARISPNPYVMDTVLIASDFKFPTANYGEEENTVKIRVVSNVRQTAIWARDLMIDCILLEPKRD